MPKFEPKIIQKELEKKKLRSFYWIYGPESMKARELAKRIKNAVFPEPGSLNDWSFEKIDGSLVSAEDIVSAALTLGFGSSVKCLWITDAHQIKNPDALIGLMIPEAPMNTETPPSVCMFLAKDLDQRKKFSKTLIEKAAVIACDEVLDQDRPAWIEYLAKRKGFQIPTPVVNQLRCLEPWSLDIVDNELEKYFLSQSDASVISFGNSDPHLAEKLIFALASKNKKETLKHLRLMSENSQDSLPFLGLLNWSIRQTRLRGQAHAWSSKWSPQELSQFLEDLSGLDFSLKSRPCLPWAQWQSTISAYLI